MKNITIDDLTLNEKIGQLLMVKHGNTVVKKGDDKFSLKSKEELDEFLKNRQFGSMWSNFQRFYNVNLAENGAELDCYTNKELLQKVKNSVRIPMLVGIDCENGAGNEFTDATIISGALTIGAADDEELAFKLSASVAKEIRAAGANWRWVPVVDIVNRYNAVSNGRGFSDDTDTVVRIARAIIKGTESAKVASTVKHFPGMDPYEIRDAHIVPTTINVSVEEWWETQGIRFQQIFDSGVDSVMVGHSAFPAVDDTNVNGRYIPATLSEKIIKGILRDKMGFEGVVITDAVEMAGLLNFGSYEEVLIMAINAGNDILLGVTPEDFDIVYKAVIDGRIPMERIDESAARVLKLKQKIGLFEEEEEVDIKVQSRITSELDKQIAEKGITLVRDYNNLIPLNPEKIKKVCIICSSHATRTKSDIQVMKQEFEKRGADVTILDVIHSRAEAESISKEFDLIVYAGFIAPHFPMGMPSLYGEHMQTYINGFTYGKEKSVGVSMGYPYMHIDIMAGANTFFNIYSPNPCSQIAFVKALYGEITPSTKSPVDIEPKIRHVYG